MLNNFEKHVFFMQKAYEQALLAYDAGEVPIGSVVVDQNDQILAQSYNQTITLNDPTAHAEILSLRKAAKRLNNYRLIDTKLYVTLEPCIMCFGALVQARVSELIYACDDTRVGVTSIRMLHQSRSFNHKFQIINGVMSQQCGELLRKFFKERRK
ncbi:tRNA-specific adenosine deaminase [Francisella halioticida]|uniref:tRNA-specific adenosine deaminase n=1 Tax=Francisella halioticida TaxID=549298 RepID=A0ABM6LXE1_9GAMM|nr:tRNA adenosine(34) deaminase TadA [Francisella halioticida]ASG67244.1 tRNA-specific adenosine deaminase [Francisella halioticida]BCD92031.1 tRNA-specific adenosine deaminase [Francisella halioticida]